MPIPRLLIVDDFGPFRLLLRKRLELLGFEVAAEAECSRRGLELFHSLRPDLVTLDLLMPDAAEFGARELFQTIRHESPGTAIVVISARGRTGNAPTFLAEGAAAYLEKSFLNFDQLSSSLRRLFPNLSNRSGRLRGQLRG